MRYLGSKIKLLSSIEKVIKQNNIQGEIFADIFAGTGCVGDYFKNKYKIISNDFLYYSYIMNCAKLQNEKMPKFQKFRTIVNDKNIFLWLNSLEFEPDDTYFFYYNYSPVGGRMFFTENNAIKIDGIRQKIEELFCKNIISQTEYYYLLASMMESITRVSNTSGTYEAFFKFWDSRAEKEFEIQPLDMCNSTLYTKHEIHNIDTNKLIREISGDIAYIDPPYTVTQYISAYHMLETLVRYDEPIIKGVGGKRSREGQNSLYAQRSKAKIIFEDLFRQIQFKHILVSYSNQGIVSLEELCQLARHFAVNGEVKIHHFDYQEYQNHRSSKKRNGKRLNEVIIYFEKDMAIRKSPINYSGSKDKLIPAITKILPKNIDTFVDVMGGAFNVGANISALNKVVYNELNPYIFEMVKMFVTEDKKELVRQIELIIKKFNLKKGDRISYESLREQYNLNKNPLYLYVLHMYSFQNMIRFNGKHTFNTPVGVAGYSEEIRDRILNFEVKCANFELINKDYIDINWNEFEKNTVFYFDPPYYITSAAYNDGKRGMKGWGIEQEKELLSILKFLDSLGYKFILSNVIKHKERTNNILLDWIEENNFKLIEAGVSGWRYAKNEILVINY